MSNKIKRPLQNFYKSLNKDVNARVAVNKDVAKQWPLKILTKEIIILNVHLPQFIRLISQLPTIIDIEYNEMGSSKFYESKMFIRAFANNQ